MISDDLSGSSDASIFHRMPKHTLSDEVDEPQFDILHETVQRAFPDDFVDDLALGVVAGGHVDTEQLIRRRLSQHDVGEVRGALRA